MDVDADVMWYKGRKNGSTRLTKRAHLQFWGGGARRAPLPPPHLWLKCDGRKPLKFGSSAAVDVGRLRRRRFGGKNEERTDADERGVSDAGVLSVGTPSGDLSWRCGGVRHVM